VRFKFRARIIPPSSPPFIIHVSIAMFSLRDQTLANKVAALELHRVHWVSRAVMDRTRSHSTRIGIKLLYDLLNLGRCPYFVRVDFHEYAMFLDFRHGSVAHLIFGVPSIALHE
jgi:hypothetical protein